MSAPAILRVAVPAPLMGLYDYLPPASAGPTPAPGHRVRVPFGKSTRIGLVMAVETHSDVPAEQLKHALELPDAAPVIPPDLLGLIAFAAGYYQHPPGDVFASAVPKALRTVQRGTSRRRRDPDQPASSAPPLSSETGPVLNDEQQAAVEAIVAGQGFRAFLLDGITGSGKTEVYLNCIRHALDQGLQSLVLVPEIGLTPQLLARFQARLGVPIAVLHSGLADGERLRAWTSAATGHAAVVLGTRSAVFTPMARPGLVIIDEEHDASYKQQEGFRYSARDLAVWRARTLGIPLVLGSATPSLESLENTRAGRYTRLVLTRRAGRAGQPSVHVVDLRTHMPTDGLTEPLRSAIRRHLSAGGQALVYLNRRGFAPTLLCTDCGHVCGCARCDARLVLHQRRARLDCHHCGAEHPVPATCPACGGPLHAVGQGTERVEEALTRAFPDEPIERIDRDTTRRRGEIARRLDRVRTGTARILLGTQMLTKGHDFPGVTLVCVIDTDQGLFGTDFRSTERLAQSLLQVAGRAGRAERPGEVWLQTLFPDHSLLRVLIREGYGAFASLALAERKQAGWPPYSALALLRAEATSRELVWGFLERAAGLARAASPAAVRILGPAAAPMEKRAGRLRGQLLLQSGARRDLQAFLPVLRAQLDALPEGRRVRWSLDVDPQELF